MRRVILHNCHDADSRRLVAEALAADPSVEVIDWYEGGREAWAASGGTMQVSALPSVVLVAEDGSVQVLRCPACWSDVP